MSRAGGLVEWHAEAPGLIHSYRPKITPAVRNGGFSFDLLRRIRRDGVSDLTPMPGSVLAPGQRCGEDHKSHDNGADHQNIADWHHSLRLFHRDEMMAWQKDLALTWIKRDGSAACE